MNILTTWLRLQSAAFLCACAVHLHPTANPSYIVCTTQMKTSLTQYDTILAHVARYITLTTEEKKFFCSLLTFKQVRRRQYVLQPGEIARHDFFVTKGCLRAYYNDESGAERIVQFALEGWWIGDMASFISSSPTLLTIDALEDSELFLIDKPGWDLLFERVPKFERFFRLLLQNAFIAFQRRILSHLAGSAEERYAELIRRYPGFVQRIPQRYIASYLGVTPEFLSRMRKNKGKKKLQR